MFAASEVETATLGMGINPAAAGLLGGMVGGVAQAYATMGTFQTARMYADPHIFDRFHYLHENGRDHSPEDSRCWGQGTVDVGFVYGHLSQGGACWGEQGCERCRRSSVHELGFSVSIYLQLAFFKFLKRGPVWALHV